MKFETRANGGDAPAPEEKSTPETGKKPVIIYIMILFLAAFTLMAISLLAHQRSNTEALGKLQSSVSAMQEVQEQIIDLQRQVDDLEQARDDAEDRLEATKAAQEDLKRQTEALLALYTLQQEYLAGDLDSCKQTLQQISNENLADLLPKEAESGVTPPAQRYQELKEAVLNAET